MTSSKTKNIRSKRKARKTRKIRGGAKRGRNGGSNAMSNVGKRMRDSSWFENMYHRNPSFRRQMDEANKLNRQSVLSMTPSNQERWEQGEDERQKRRNNYIMKDKAKPSITTQSPNRSPQGQGNHSSVSTNYTNRLKKSMAVLAKSIPEQNTIRKQREQEKKEEIDETKAEIESTEQRKRDLETSIRTLETRPTRSLGTLLRSPMDFVRGEQPIEIRMELERLEKERKETQQYLLELNKQLQAMS